ncbi:DUF4031 domain-containing protein [Embleya sp. NPDC020630]|uniref:DUF4031 domain-containing protein n=1 Tax=Embleya sp. NPDC020630 TaxID=3363979 RepID=UPI0037BAA5CC
MAVYVDEITHYPNAARIKGLRHTHWSHLTADTQEELHEFAARLGLKRAWYQAHEYRWHYDVTPNVRSAALRLGAVEIDRYGLAAVVNARRVELYGPSGGTYDAWIAARHPANRRPDEQLALDDRP